MTRNAKTGQARSPWLRWTRRIAVAVLVLFVLALLVLAFWLRGPLYNRFILFPRQARAWQAIRDARVPVPRQHGWKDYRGFCHSHSEFSHDCEVPFTRIAEVMKETGCDFAFMSDHCVDGEADYGLQWRGIKDGMLFVAGFEMNDGFMPWGLPPDTVLDCGADPKDLAKQIDDLGGMLFFAHCEEPRHWELPQLVGMEIYNIHTDFKDENFADLAPYILLSIAAYPDQAFRLLFDRQTDLLALWDELNLTRKIVGIAANDCHQNNGIRAKYTERGTLLIEDTSPDEIGEYGMNPFSRFLIRILFGKPEPGKEVFHFQLDPYERMVRFVNTHLLAKELTEEALLDALRQGRAFIGFDMIADSAGFIWLAQGGQEQAVMGECIPYAAGIRLAAASPHRCRFTILCQGKTVYQEEGTEVTFKPDGPGKYRVEAELDILGEWTPWVYTNPIELTPPRAS